MKKLTQNVNKDKMLNDLPKVRPEFSKWLTRHTNYISSNIGQIVPIYVDEVLPGEKRKITMGMTSHTVTPIAPIFNSLYTEIRSFFVPYRLCADLLNGYKSRKSPFVQVFGEDPSSENSNIVVSLDNQKLPDFTIEHNFIKDIYNYMDSYDSADNVFNTLDYEDETISLDSLIEYNFLELAAYELIYQRHYRNENYESATESELYQLLFDAYNVSKASVGISSTFTYEIANREKDYFTGMKPFTQKGDPVEVSLGDTANLKADSSLHDLKAPLQLADKDGRATKDYLGVYNAVGSSKNEVWAVHDPEGGNISASLLSGGYPISKTNLVVDLASAKGISIEDLRLLIKTQELLEKDAMYGSRYAESLNSHFGTAPLDLTLQDPQELYKTTITSNMQAIFQTSSTSGEESILGTIGANSTTQTDPFVILPETEFKEHGILMICAVHKLQNVYDSLVFKPKMRFKKARFDFYTPELNDLGFQEVSDKEMRSVSGRAGFNEAFAEYRFKFNKVHGRLAIEFPYWAPAISDEYASVSTLYKEDPAILDKALSVRSDIAPQFYDAWGFEEENTKPMSLHSIPGMDGVI